MDNEYDEERFKSLDQIYDLISSYLEKSELRRIEYEREEEVRRLERARRFELRRIEYARLEKEARKKKRERRRLRDQERAAQKLVSEFWKRRLRPRNLQNQSKKKRRTGKKRHPTARPKKKNQNCKANTTNFTSYEQSRRKSLQRREQNRNQICKQTKIRIDIKVKMKKLPTRSKLVRSKEEFKRRDVAKITKYLAGIRKEDVTKLIRTAVEVGRQKSNPEIKEGNQGVKTEIEEQNPTNLRCGRERFEDYDLATTSGLGESATAGSGMSKRTE